MHARGVHGREGVSLEARDLQRFTMCNKDGSLVTLGRRQTSWRHSSPQQPRARRRGATLRVLSRQSLANGAHCCRQCACELCSWRWSSQNTGPESRRRSNRSGPSDEPYGPPIAVAASEKPRVAAGETKAAAAFVSATATALPLRQKKVVVFIGTASCGTALVCSSTLSQRRRRRLAHQDQGTQVGSAAGRAR